MRAEMEGGLEDGGIRARVEVAVVEEEHFGSGDLKARK